MDIKNYIYGRNAVSEALNTNYRKVNKILISKNASNDVKINEIIQKAKSNGIVFQYVPKEKFRDFEGLPHQGVLAMVSPVE